jgi:hypothetical protein
MAPHRHPVSIVYFWAPNNTSSKPIVSIFWWIYRIGTISCTTGRWAWRLLELLYVDRLHRNSSLNKYSDQLQHEDRCDGWKFHAIVPAIHEKGAAPVGVDPNLLMASIFPFSLLLLLVDKNCSGIHNFRWPTKVRVITSVGYGRLIKVIYFYFLYNRKQNCLRHKFT